MELSETRRVFVNKTSRCTEFQFYWYYESTCFGQPFWPSSGFLPYIGFGTFYAVVMTGFPGQPVITTA
jgi:hypothetical protein